MEEVGESLKKKVYEEKISLEAAISSRQPTKLTH